MSYPDDKEIWTRRETDDIIPKGDCNNWEIFLEALQDTFGLGIKMGYATVKLFFDYCKSKCDLVDSKLNSTNPDATGYLITRNDTVHRSIKNAAGNTKVVEAWNETDKWFNVNLHNLDYFVFRKDDVHYLGFTTSGPHIAINVAMFINGNVELQAEVGMTGNTDLANNGPGKGIKARTPDDTKSYRISVDNAGNVISTLV